MVDEDMVNHLGFQIREPMDMWLEGLIRWAPRLDVAVVGTKRFTSSATFQARVGAFAEMAQIWLDMGGQVVELELFDIHRASQPDPRLFDRVRAGRNTRQFIAECRTEELVALIDDDDIWHYGIRVASGVDVTRLHEQFQVLTAADPNYRLRSDDVVSNRWHGSMHTKLANRDAGVEIEFLSYTRLGRLDGLSMPDIRPLSELTDPRRFLGYLDHVGAQLPFDADVAHGPSSPLARPVSFSGLTAGNRLCVHPLEGWDADVEGRPTSSTRERWRRMGQGGAKLIWAESAAVRPDGRSTPTQLLVTDDTVSDLAALRQLAVDEHERVHGDVSDLVVGLQLTHSGRMSHPAPHGVPAPVAVRRHPHMDATVGPPPDQPLLTDDELYSLADDFVRAAVNAAVAGFDFVDLKACHGYLHHELLGAYERPGDFGGPLENRTRFLRTVIDGVRALRRDSPRASPQRLRYGDACPGRRRIRKADHQRTGPVLVRHR